MSLWTTEQRGAVLVATYSNPPRNYLVAPALVELDQLIDEWGDSTIRAVVIQSRPDDAGFMTHYSVEELHALISDPKTSRYSSVIVRNYKVLLDKLQKLPKVVIAAMNGDTMGGGFELTLACDLRIGERGDFRYGNPEVRVGLIPGAGGTQRLTRLVGVARATEWVLRGRVVTPEVALSLGLVHEVVDDAPTRAFELAQEIACFPPKAVANSKAALYQGHDTTMQAGSEIENMQWAEVMQSDDAQLALQTYIDVPLDGRREFFEPSSSPSYPAYAGE
jgi:enoyl-CoA hydratase/carnithine racemase